MREPQQTTIGAWRYTVRPLPTGTGLALMWRLARMLGPALASRLREEGLYVVPVHGGLRIALCSVPERALQRLASGIAKHNTPA